MNYVKSTNFASKDTLPLGNPLKVVKGTEIDQEFNNISNAIVTKADSDGSNATGTWPVNVTGSAAKWTTPRSLSLTGDATASLSVDGSADVAGALTLANALSTPGTFGSSTAIPVVTFDAKGRATTVTTAVVAGGQYFGNQTTKAIAYNSNTITENVTITSGNNATSAGPMTIANTFTVTVETGANWVIV